MLAAVTQNGFALEYAADELKGDPALQQCKHLNPHLSLIQLVAELRLHLAYACDERVGFESLKVLPLDVIELIGKHITIRVVLHGLIRRRALPLSEGFLSE